MRIAIAAIVFNAILCSIYATTPDVLLISNAILMAAMIVKGEWTK